MTKRHFEAFARESLRTLDRRLRVWPMREPFSEVTTMRDTIDGINEGAWEKAMRKPSRPIRYVVARPIAGRVHVREFLDTTDPDTWTLDARKALSSEDEFWIRRHSQRRPGTHVEER